MPLTSIDHPLLRRAKTALAVAVSALALGACGGGDDEPAVTTSGGSASAASSSSNARDAARVRLTQCLRENGVDVPDDAGQGGLPPSDIDQEKLQAALTGPCEELQDGAFGDASGADQQEFSDDFAKFSSCMRAEGVEVPDVEPGAGPPQGADLPDLNDPDVRAATEKCEDVLPGGLPGAGAAEGE